MDLTIIATSLSLLFCAAPKPKPKFFKEVVGQRYKLSYPSSWNLWDDRNSSSVVSLSLKRDTGCCGVMKLAHLRVRTYWAGDGSAGFTLDKAGFVDAAEMTLGFLDQGEKYANFEGDQEISILGKLRGHGSKVYTTDDDKKSKVVFLAFYVSMDDPTFADGKLPANLKGTYLVIDGYYFQTLQGKDALNPHEVASLEALLSSIEILPESKSKQDE